MSTVREPATIVSTAPTQRQGVPTVAAGRPATSTLATPGAATGPPRCGTGGAPGEASGHVWGSPTRATGGIVS